MPGVLVRIQPKQSTDMRILQPFGAWAEAKRKQRRLDSLTISSGRNAQAKVKLFTYMSGRFSSGDRESGKTRFGGFFLACNFPLIVTMKITC